MAKRLISLALAVLMVLGSVGLAAAAPEEGRVINLMRETLSFDINDDYVYHLLKENTGYDVHYEYWSDEKQLALEIASGSEMDLICVSTNMYQNLLAQGALKDMSAALAEFPEITDAIAERGWKYVTGVDGGIYGIPQVDDAVYVGGLTYRTDIFADNGYTEPNTIEEFEALLRQIKEDTGLIPLTGNSAVEAVIASGFGLSHEYVVDEETDTIKSWLRQPGMKEYLAWMNKMYNEGLIDVDWPVNTGDMITEKMSSGKAVITYGWHGAPKPWYEALVANGDTDAYFKTIIPLEDKDGERHTVVSNGVALVWISPASIDDDDLKYALEMVASRLDEKTYWLFNDGIEGTHYYFDEEGFAIPIQPLFGENMQWGDKYQIGRNQYVHPFSWMARVHKSQSQWDTFYDANSKAAAYGFEAKPLTYASFDAYTQYSAALTTLCNDYFKQVIAGTESLDTYDDFVAEWEAAGGLEVEDGATEWYHNNKDLVEEAKKCDSPYNSIFGYTVD